MQLIVISDLDVEVIRNHLAVRKTWTKVEFPKAYKQISSCRFISSPSPDELVRMNELVKTHHELLLRRIEPCIDGSKFYIQTFSGSLSSG
ncbi:MAG TPA: hypothetical protein O0W81_02540 [Methanocorpusculum sp.]|nr:hypothetical protein [Methanocorpusculum sp.]